MPSSTLPSSAAPPSAVLPSVVLDGSTLTPAQVAALARRVAAAVVAPEARARVAAARAAAVRIAGRRTVYGHTTGVGANRTAAVADPAAAAAYGMRLLRSHAGGVGPLVPQEQARAMLAVRLNQLLRGGSAAGVAVVDALAGALASGHTPQLHALGALGTADLTALAELGLTLAGERPWAEPDPAHSASADGSLSPNTTGTYGLSESTSPAGPHTDPVPMSGPASAAVPAPASAPVSVSASTTGAGAHVSAAAPRVPGPTQPGRPRRPGRSAGGAGAGAGAAAPPLAVALTHWDALPLMSSSALTLGQSAVAAHDLRALLERGALVAALTLTAVNGSLEPFAAAVHVARPHAGAGAVAARMRALLARPDWEPALVQDPFGLRCLPQVQGAALDACAALEAVLAVELNAAAENPLLDLAADDYHHHGGFHQASLALASDQLRLAVLGAAELSAARLGVLVEPAFTGLPPFLAESGGPDAEGSSGVMITEYAVQSVLAELRTAAQPVTLGHAVISRGVEEHASFAATGARRLLDCVGWLRLVMAAELVAAVRALRMLKAVPAGSPELATCYERAAAVLPADTADRSLTADIEAAAGVLDSLG